MLISRLANKVNQAELFGTNFKLLFSTKLVMKLRIYLPVSFSHRRQCQVEQDDVQQVGQIKVDSLQTFSPLEKQHEDSFEVNVNI